MSALFEFCVTDSGELLSTETQPAVSELLSEVHWNCRMRKQILTAFRYKLTYARQAQNTTETQQAAGLENQSNAAGRREEYGSALRA